MLGPYNFACFGSKCPSPSYSSLSVGRASGGAHAKSLVTRRTDAHLATLTLFVLGYVCQGCTQYEIADNVNKCGRTPTRREPLPSFKVRVYVSECASPFVRLRTLLRKVLIFWTGQSGRSDNPLFSLSQLRAAVRSARGTRNWRGRNIIVGDTIDIRTRRAVGPSMTRPHSQVSCRLGASSFLSD